MTLGGLITLALISLKVISLAPNITDMMRFMGLEKHIVGVTNFDNFPAKRVGAIVRPDVETIVKLKPDLVIYSPLTSANVIETLKRAGIKTLGITYNSLDDVAYSFEVIASAISSPEIGKEAKRKFLMELEELARRVKGRGRKVVVLIACARPTAVGSGNYIDDLIKLAGFENVVNRKGFVVFDLEAFVKLKADVTILACHDASNPPFIHGDVKKVNPDDLLRPGPRLLNALIDLM